MTRSPSNLLAARKLLLTHLNIDESRVRSQDLEPAEVGIVGDSAHRGGYHCGSDRVVSGDYSVVESPRDRAGLTLDAAALDVGQFEVTVGGRTYDLPHFSAWCVGQCKANAVDTRDIREIIWSPDGRTVKRWDRLGKRSTGDSSHRWHTHISYHRDAIKAGRDQTPLFRRYLTTIGLIEGDDDMSEKASQVIEAWARGMPKDKAGASVEPVLWRIRDEAWQKRVDGLLVALAASVEGLDMDAVLRRLDEHAEAERQRDEAAAQRDAELAELVRQANSGELAANEFVRRVGELFAQASGAPADPTQ